VDREGAGLLKGLSFAVTGAEGASIESVEAGDSWSERAIHIAQSDEGAWGFGITETGESSLRGGSSLVKIVFRLDNNDLDPARALQIRELKVSLTNGEIITLGELDNSATGRIALPKAYSLAQNSPNPFNPSTTISYSVPEGNTDHVSLSVYDLRGRLIRTLVDQVREAGNYSVFWDGTDRFGRQVSSGVYFYRIRAGEFTQSRKMVLLK
jgi:hypothetical protein